MLTFEELEVGRTYLFKQAASKEELESLSRWAYMLLDCSIEQITDKCIKISSTNHGSSWFTKEDFKLLYTPIEKLL